MKHFHQYLENQKDQDGLEVGNKKDQFHMLNDNIYQSQE